MERRLPVGGRRPPAHRHSNCSEGFFVLEGTIAVELDGESLGADAGDFVLAPRGTLHTFGNAGTALARLLIVHAPAMDAYFQALHELWAREAPPTAEEERALMARFGVEQ
ncbi:MAG: cupin domain-containing protein [Actinomycetes bacterium]